MLFANTTVDPTAHASAVEQPEITEVRSTRSGLILNTRQYIGSQRYDRLIRTRNMIRDRIHGGEPRLVCGVCSVPVYLVASVHKAFFFRHTVEDGSCPAQTRGSCSYEQIKAMKYHGAQESDAHRRMKTRLERSLCLDPGASEIYQEKTWRAAGSPKVYRRPDVQAVYAGFRLAFEAQLSTTFLDVVVGRRAFYRQDGALLVWVLPRFDSSYRRLTEDDILFTNNHNVLVVNEETAKLSEANRQCTFLCHYREPFLKGDVVEEKWSERMVAMADLTFDLRNQRAFYFDFDQQLMLVRREMADREARHADELRLDFFAFWERNGGWENSDEDQDEQWREFRERFIQIGVDVPSNHKTRTFRAAVSGLMSAKFGRPIGFSYEKLIQVAHKLADGDKGVVRAFGWALRVYDTKSILDREDGTGRWRTKAAGIRAAMSSGDPAYEPDVTWGAALRFLFPELTDRIPVA